MAESKEDKKKLLDDVWESYAKHNEQESFNWIKELYEALREKQRIKIIDYLALKGFKVSKQGGHGHKDYNNGNRLGKSYDISNWKWIDVKKDIDGKEKKILISLQPFDYDKSMRDYHVLMDRLGIYLYHKENGKKTPDALDRMFLTDIELPMDDEKLEELEKILNNTFLYWNEMEEVYKNYKAKSEYKEECEKIKLYNTVNEKQTLLEQIFDIVKERK